MQDLNGHGTHCASIAAGTGAASGGQYRGVAPDASLYIAKVLDAAGNGRMTSVMAGVEWAVDEGVQVISLSLGGSGPCDGTDALSEMCDAAVAEGVVVCVAAGNEGPEPYTVGAPGCARDVITIGAANDLDRIAAFSSRGPTRDGGSAGRRATRWRSSPHAPGHPHGHRRRRSLCRDLGLRVPRPTPRASALSSRRAA